jgi:hypothetical protein
LWPSLSGSFKSYRFANYEGTGMVSARTGDETGGWRLILENENESAFIFARGSRTEAGVWRLIVDDPNPTRGEQLIGVARAMMAAASQ